MDNQQPPQKKTGLMHSAYAVPIAVGFLGEAIYLFLQAFSLGPQQLRTVVQGVTVALVAVLFFTEVFKKK